MNERPNRRREERGSRVRDERSQNRPADYGDRPRRSSQKHKGGKVLYYGVPVSYTHLPRAAAELRPDRSILHQ